MTDHYFTAQPESEPTWRRVEYSARGFTYEATVSDGVFSSHGLDKGTRVFLDHVPHSSVAFSNESDEVELGATGTTGLTSRTYSPSAPLLVDLGCGWGAIALAMAREYPHAQVLAVDVNERALDLTRRNAASLGCTNLTVKEASAALAHLHVTNAHIDLMWSNPPIRIGKAKLHELMLSWLELLKSETGEAYWVVQKNLGADSLTAWLSEQGYPSEKIASQKGFRVIRSKSRCQM